jgi:hypothetical protein
LVQHLPSFSATAELFAPSNAQHARVRSTDMFMTRAARKIMGSLGCVLSPAAVHPTVADVPITAACPDVLSCIEKGRLQLSRWTLQSSALCAGAG